MRDYVVDSLLPLMISVVFTAIWLLAVDLLFKLNDQQPHFRQFYDCKALCYLYLLLKLWKEYLLNNGQI